MSPELTDDVLDIVLVDEDVPVHDRLRGNTVLNACQDLLLVLKWDLGVGDQDRGDKGMGSPLHQTRWTIRHRKSDMIFTWRR